MAHLGIPALAAIFAAAVAVVWIAGIQLSNTTDEIDARFGLGEAVGGLVLLAVATNLPEIAIVATAGAQHHFDIATGNILGGIAIQTVVLVALDGFGVPRRALTNATASLVQVLEGVLVIAVVAVAIAATLLPKSLVVARVDPSALLIAVFWVGGLWFIRRASRNLPWKASRTDAADAGRKRRAGSRKARPIGMTLGIFGAAGLATLLAGIGLEESGNAIADQVHLNGAVFGGTVLAAATALPELSTGLAAVKLEDFELAVSDIFGGNAFLPVLFLPATLLAGESVLGRAQKTDVFLAVLAILLTTVYMFGLILRPRKQYLRLGPDSIAVLVLYVLGIAGLVVVSRSG
ncbi:MAG: sodium:calcium antiporter [Candidatus Dormibacteraeota bacterium]|nr:sodium:calcium antiporter [Candidatus Dormibacteraeota bacterium]